MTDTTQQVVFIDSNVPDIQDLIDGVEPGVQVFVLQPGSDGVEQIADILAANNLRDLSSISIVSHGADGEVMLGSATLSEANLASYSRALAEIGTAVAPGGDIQLYGCDVALGATGQQFINDFSTLAGGVTVEAATHVVGSANFGGNWTLDAASNNPVPVNGAASPASTTVSSPFTSQALANFQGDLATQGTGVVFDLSSGNQVDQRIEDVVNNSTTASDLFQETGGGVFGVGTPGPAIVIDTVANLYFVLNGGQTNAQLLEGTLNSTADPTEVAAWDSFYTTSGLSHQVSIGQSEVDPGALAIDLTNHRIFIGVGSNLASENGFIALTYSQSTAAVSSISYIATMSTGGAQPSSPEEMVYNNNTIYFIDNAVGTINENGVYRIDLGTGSFTQMVTQTQFPLFSGGTFPSGGLTGIALDPVNGRLFFSTRDANSIGSTQDAIWEVSANASNATAIKLGLPAGVTILEADALTYDKQKNVLYWANHDDVDATPVNNIVMAQLNAAGTSVVSVTTIDPGLPSANNDEPQISSLQFDELPTLSITPTVNATFTESSLNPASLHNSPIGLISGDSISDTDNTSVNSATVSISGFFAGDTLSFTNNNNITGSYNSSTGVLTFSGIDSFADYQTALQSVNFTSTSDNPTNYGSDTTRELDWTVSDGAPDVPFGNVNSASSTITVVGVNDPPTLSNFTASPQFTEEHAAATLATGLSVVDVDDLNLSSATVAITGGSFAGDTDTLAVSGASGGTFDGGKITVSYNSTTQVLTLTGSDTLAEYQAALDEVTFTSNENPTNFGSNTTRTITWVAKDPSGTALGGQDTSSISTTTLTVINVNDPPTLALGTTTAQWTEEQSPAATSLSPSVSITDADSLDLVSATVSITGGAFTGDQLLVSGQTSGVVIAGTNITPTFTGNGIVTFSGSDTLADYQSALELITYNGGENPTDFGSDPTRTLTWTLNDGGGTANGGVQIGTATSTVSVTFVNDAPTLTNVATTAQYTEGAGGTTLSSALSVTDADDLNLSSATVTVTGGSFSGDGDLLAANGISNGTAVNAGHTISIFYNSSTETLTLNGTDTIADYLFLLDRVTYRSSSDNPTNYGSNTTRTLSWVVTDPSGTLNGGQDTSSTSLTTVTVTGVNDPPTLALGTTTASWTEEQASPTSLAPAATVTDPDNLDLASASVQITGGTFTGDSDTLAIGGATSGTVGAISFSYNSTSETLTLTGSDTLANYQTLLNSITFNAGENPTDFGSKPTRTLTWTLNDGSASLSTGTATSTVSVTFVNDAPTLTGVAPSVSGAPASTVTLSPSVTVTDADDLFLTSATVAITGGTFVGDGDVLTAEATSNGTFVQSGHTITIAYNSTTETLTLTGSDTLADYQNVLDTVAWHSPSVDPTNSGSNPTRTISWVAHDPSGTLNGGSDTSTPQTETLLIDQPPVLSGLTQTASWTEEQASPTTLSPSVTISDPDGVTTQLSATVSITGGTFTNDHDTLAINGATSGTLDGGNISFSYNSTTETLTLTGSDTLAAYQNALDAVTFNGGENPTNFGSNLTRTLTWTVADYVATESAPVTTTVSITNVNDAPTLSNVPASANFTEEGAAVTLASAVSVSDPDDLNLVSATVAISGGTFSGDGDTLAISGATSGTLDGGKIAYSYNSTTETLTLTGSDTLAAYQNALDGITFNAAENPTNFGSNPTRTLTWTLNDGGGTLNGGVQISAPVTSTVSITNINDQPTLSNVATSVNFTEEGGPVTLSGAVSASDPDNVTLVGATVKVNGGTFVGDGDVLSATGTSSITVSYNSSTETLTLSGTDTLAHYQSVLDTVTFNAGENPNNFGSNPIRTVTWTLDDGRASNNLSTVQTTTVSITNVNDAPTLSNVAASANFTEEGGPVTLSSAVSVTDPDNLKLTGATVKITGGTFASDGDQLAASAVGTITVNYDSSSETLTLTGTDTLANYRTVLDTVTFNDGENPTNFGSNPTRTLTWQLNDGSVSNSLSALVTSTVSITNVNDAPTLTNVAPSANFTEEGGAVTLSGAVAVTDPDDLNLSGGTVKITGGTFANDQDVLSANTAGTSITASYNSSTETLTLSGLDTLAHYQSVLDKVTFNAGENPNDYGSNPTRTLTWTLMDPGGTANGGVNVSTPVTSTVSITNVNDPPTLSNVASLANVGFTFQTITISPSASVSDPDNLKLANATVQITGGTFPGDGDVLAATVAGTSITASYNSSTETLTLTGSDTLADYQQVLDSVTFHSTNPNATNSGADRTRTVTWTLNDGSGSNNVSAPATTTIQFQNAVHYDFNGDSVSDFAFQQEQGNAGTKGTPQIWLWNGTSVTSMTTLANPGAAWRVVASADVNGDGMADLIWQANNGQPGIWLMNGPTPIAQAGLTNPGANWHLIASGDFNADGKADLLFQESGGTLGVWLMNGTTPMAEAAIGNPGPTWIPVGTADFNNDGHDDILLQNKTTGNLMIDLMNGTTVTSSVTINVGDPSWHAVSTGTFNGVPEIAWQNDNGTPGIWLFNGTTPSAEAVLPNPGTSWQVVSLDHFTPNGQGDLLFQNINGGLGVWELNGTSIVAEIGLPNPGFGVDSVNGNPAVDPPGNSPNFNASLVNAANSATTASTTSDSTLRQSMPDTTNSASVLNASAPGNGTMHSSAPDLSSAGATGVGAGGSPAFTVGTGLLSQNLLATPDPNSTQHLLFTGG